MSDVKRLSPSCDTCPVLSRPPRQEEPALFSPEVDVHRGDPLSFDQVEHALQSSFEAKEDILMASLPSPLTPYTRTPQAPRMTEKDIPPLPCLLEVSDQCPSPPTSSPPGTPSLSPINNTAMVQAAAATGGAQLMNVCGSGSKTTSTPAKVAHAQRTAAGEFHSLPTHIYRRYWTNSGGSETCLRQQPVVQFTLRWLIYRGTLCQLK